MRDVLLEKIVEKHKDFLQFKALVEQKSQEIKKSKEELQGNTELSLEKTAKHYTDVYVDLVLFTRDMQVIFTKLVIEIDLFKELGYEGLPEEIVEFYTNNKSHIPAQTFIIKDNKVIEREEGILAKERKNFLDNSPLMQQLKEANE